MANSSTAQDGFKALEQKSLESLGAQFESGEVKTSFPPPENGLTASKGESPGQVPAINQNQDVPSTESATSTTEDSKSVLGGGAPTLVAIRQMGMDDGNGNIYYPPKKVVQQRFYGNSKENTWVPDSNSSGKTIVFTSLQNAQTRADFILAAGEWEEAKAITSVLGGKNVFTVVKKGRRTLNNFIRLVEKLEKAYPKRQPREIIEMLRWISGYKEFEFNRLVGTDAIEPKVNKIFTKADMDALAAMMSHSGWGEKERGVARDNQGEMVAMGHVITGMSSGYNYERRRNMIPGRPDMDNVYAMTLSGDLGQSAAQKKDGGTNQRFIGDNTEATIPELVGDVDGLNLGEHIAQGGAGNKKISTQLREYYNGYSDKDSTVRWRNTLARTNYARLSDEAKRFAASYRHKSDKLDFSGADAAAETATLQFLQHANGRAKETPRASWMPNTQVRKTIRTQGSDLAYLSKNASQYKETKIASLPPGTKVCPLDAGDNQHFNQNLADRAQFGFTYCMVMTGNFEGQVGWISNKFIKDR
jgi:hypothetical protein